MLTTEMTMANTTDPTQRFARRVSRKPIRLELSLAPREAARPRAA